MRKLTPALITSYDMSGNLGPDPDAPQLLPEGVDPTNLNLGIDVYLMMECDVAAWSKRWNENTDSAVDCLATIHDHQIDELCNDLLFKFETSNVQPVATTSFIAELSNKSAHEGNYRETPYGKAITNYFRIADRLQANRDVSVAQMVAGNVLDKFQADESSSTSGPRFSVSATETESLIQVVLDRLSECLEAATESGVDSQRLRIALELEPGPLYLLKDANSLCQFSEAIDNHPSRLVQHCVGFNLDIAHWWLAQLRDESDVPQHVGRKIYGAHIAGHSSRGHFGDLPLSQLNPDYPSSESPNQQQEAYKSWLRFLCDPSKTPNHSGHVSLEFEAAKDVSEIGPSLQLLDRWIHELNS